MWDFFLGGGGGWAELEPPAGTETDAGSIEHILHSDHDEASKIQTQSTMQDAIVGETIHGTSNMFCLRERFSP